MVNFPPLDIQSYLLRFGVGPACFFGVQVPSFREVFFSCLGLMKMPTIICSKNPGTWKKKTSWTVWKLWPWENLFWVTCEELNLQTSDPSTLFLWIYREGPISKTLPILRVKKLGVRSWTHLTKFPEISPPFLAPWSPQLLQFDDLHCHLWIGRGAWCHSGLQRNQRCFTQQANGGA